MLRISQLKTSITKDNIDYLKHKCANLLKVSPSQITTFTIYKKSLDARKKPELYYIYEIDISIPNEDKFLKHNSNPHITKSKEHKYQFPNSGTTHLKNRPIIVGAGPSGLFCAYMLALHGYNPIIIERGDPIDQRTQKVTTFWNTNKLDPESNVQFGEGGAGTFSDGKLVTQIKDKENRGSQVMDIFIASGAPKEIKYLHKPHLGTDLLSNIIINLRNKIISMGGEFYYQSKLTNIILENNTIKAIEINNSQIIPTQILVLAIGHSARDTFNMLYKNNIPLEPKPFAVGIRIQHPQSLINQNQYGNKYSSSLGAASYKLTYKSTTGRGVYTFCMCPGGYVVNSSSEPGKLCINGMSNYARNTLNANSALIVTISPKDFGLNPLDGVKFQQALETKAYLLGNGLIPTQTFKDYLENVSTTKFGHINPITKGNYTLTNLNSLFPDYINISLKEAIQHFDKIIPGYADPDAIIQAVESRTSSPLRIPRNSQGESSISGLYPCGEGSGYAGGITSAAIDGIKIAESLAKIYKPFQ